MKDKEGNELEIGDYVWCPVNNFIYRIIQISVDGKSGQVVVTHKSREGVFWRQRYPINSVGASKIEKVSLEDITALILKGKCEGWIQTFSC